METLLQDLELMRHHTKQFYGPQSLKLVVMLCGLPGTGKSTLAAHLSQEFGLVHLESDYLRRKLFGCPTHSGQESVRLFTAIYERARELLSEGYGLLFDSTNLIESHRQITYDIAQNAKAKLIIIRLVCSPSVVKSRLRQRVLREGQNSNADWQVYKKLSKTEDQIIPKHYVLDASSEQVFSKATEIIIKENAND